MLKDKTREVKNSPASLSSAPLSDLEEYESTSLSLNLDGVDPDQEQTDHVKVS